MQERALRILQGKASDVAAGIRRSATLQQLSPKARENADKAADYLLKYREHLRYDEYLEKGYPIARSVIEGACRHLVNDRMDITGARWRLDQTILENMICDFGLKQASDFADEDNPKSFNQTIMFSKIIQSKISKPLLLRRGQSKIQNHSIQNRDDF